MKHPGAVERSRLVVLLEAALKREDRLWKVPVFKNGFIQVRHSQVHVLALVGFKRAVVAIHSRLLSLRAQTSLQRSTEK